MGGGSGESGLLGMILIVWARGGGGQASGRESRRGGEGGSRLWVVGAGRGGTGGIWTELFDDVCVRPLGLGSGEAMEMLKSLKGYPLLLGVRGKPACDIEAVALLIEKLDAFVREFGDKIAAIDLNPIMVTPKAAVIVDTLVVPKG